MNDSGLYFFESSILEELVKKYKPVYQLTSPFPHAVIENILPREIALMASKQFPNSDDHKWMTRPDNHKYQQKKLKIYDEHLFSPFFRHLFGQFNSAIFCIFLEKLTGIDGIIPDPYYWGGGLHSIKNNGFLKVHVDFNWHEKLKLYRRINLLLYLNENWKEEYGGHLELWNEEMSKCEVSISPTLGKCVIFNTSEKSYHGHPDPINCGNDNTRKSMALYYYTATSPNEIRENRRTTYKLRQGESPFKYTEEKHKTIEPKN